MGCTSHFSETQGKTGLEDVIFKLTSLWEYERKGNEIARGKSNLGLLRLPLEKIKSFHSSALSA